MSNGKKSQSDTKENASSTIIEDNPENMPNSGRTVILRDQFGELVLSSSSESDTLVSMLNLANKQKMYQQNTPPIELPPGPRNYHG